MSALKKVAPFLYPGDAPLGVDIGLLVARVAFGGLMVLGHGWGKLTGFSDIAPNFPDPLGIGSTLSLALAVGAEFFCALALVAGFLTRLQTIPLIITMLVATFLVNVGKIPEGQNSIGAIIKPLELSGLYLLGYITLLLAGPGRFSVDALIFSKK